MFKVRICFEVNGLSTDEVGEPRTAGMEITICEIEKEIDYAELSKNVNIPGILKFTCLDTIVKPEDVKIITPEEYDSRFGDSADETLSQIGEQE